MDAREPVDPDGNAEGAKPVEASPDAISAQGSKEPGDPSLPSHIVCLGASAGGLEALQSFFSAMRSDSGAAFVVVLHLSPDFKSLMPELISRHTSMQITPASEGISLERNWIYIIPPGKNMVYEGGQLHLHDQDRTPGHALNLPIDIFLNSVASESGDNVIGIILSGTGSDGSRGVRALKDAGGIVMAQEPESASFDGMPRSVIETGVVDACAIPSKLASLVAEVTRNLHNDMQVPAHADSAHAENLHPVLEEMRTHFNLDLSYLRTAMLQRRVRRRMALLSIRTVPEYVERLREDVKEAVALRRDVFIGVTGFFRDAKPFEFIRAHLANDVFKKPEAEPIRLWVPACATGEEVYSLAMLTVEVLERLGTKRDVKIFATDIDEEALARASRGVYSASSVADVSVARLARFFDSHDGVYTVKPLLREMVICAKHNLVTDPPFTRIDLVSCRNFLIYLDQESQEQVLASLHFSLRENGTLFLGQAEALGRLENEFTTTHPKYKVFKKSRNVILPSMRRRSGLQDPIAIVPRQTRRAPTDRESPIRAVLDAVIALEGQTAALVTSDGALLEILSDPIGVFQLPTGKATTDIIRLVSSDLTIPLTTGLQRLKRDESELRYTARLSGNPVRQVKMKLKKLPAVQNDQADRVLIVVEPIVAAENERPVALDRSLDEDTNQQMQELQLELQQTRETLQATIEELQSSNEEQQSTNEELVASNEELQSTNEELQSVNEELFTVNIEYQNKIQELAVLAADLDNLLKNIDVGTLFLDQDLRIRKFTPAVDRVIKLVEHDIGRPIQHFAHNLGSDLVEDVTRVMREGGQIEREVRSNSGSWLLVRILPYLTHAGSPDGVVMTVVDITPIKNAQQMTRVTNDQLAHANKELSRQREELEDLFSIVAHDLKRPVVALDGLLKIVERADPTVDPETGDCVARAIVECQRMGRMLEDLSSLSAATRREHAFEDVELEPWLDELVGRYRASAGERGIQLNCTCDAAVVQIPRSALEESLVNLVENALNYGSGNERPRVDIACRVSDGVLEISVRDNGQGIAPENHHKVFEPFRRLDPDMAEGSGVGLVAARRVVGRHGGVIGLDSSAGRGAKFTVRLPVELGRSPLQFSKNSHKVLVVEDDVLDAKAIERALGDGYAATRAKDLAAAVSALGQTKFDSIVLDLSLPDGHGLELIHHLRTELDMDTPVVVVTGHGEGITPPMMTATVSGFVAKSELRGDTLRAAVANAIESHSGPGRRTVFAPNEN